MGGVGKDVHYAILSGGLSRLHYPQAEQSQVVYVVRRVQEGYGVRRTPRGGGQQDRAVFPIQSQPDTGGTRQQGPHQVGGLSLQRLRVGQDQEVAHPVLRHRGG